MLINLSTLVRRMCILESSRDFVFPKPVFGQSQCVHQVADFVNHLKSQLEVNSLIKYHIMNEEYFDNRSIIIYKNINKIYSTYRNQPNHRQELFTCNLWLTLEIGKA